MSKGAGFAVAAGIGAAVLIGCGSGVASADEGGSADTSEQRDAGPRSDEGDDDAAAERSSSTDDAQGEAEAGSDETTGDTDTDTDDAQAEAEDAAVDEAVEEELADGSEDEGSVGGGSGSAGATTVVEVDDLGPGSGSNLSPGADDVPADSAQTGVEAPIPAPPVVAAQLLSTTVVARRTSEAQPPAALAATVAHAAVGNAIVYTDPPTAFDRLVVAGLRVMRTISTAIRIDLYGLIGAALQSSRPPWFVRPRLDVAATDYDAVDGTVWKVWEFHPPNPTGKTVVAVHGGGFIAKPLVTHWLAYADMARDTGATVIVPMYPLATSPAGTAVRVVPAMAQFISDAIAEHGAANVSIYADSAGPSLAMAAVRALVLDGKPLPASMVLLSFAPDASLSNPDIAGVDDPVVDVGNRDFSIRENHWGDGLDAEDPLLSPLFFDDHVLAALPPTTIYVGELEYALPDTLLLHQKWTAAGGAVSTVVGRGMFRDWALGGLLVNSAGPKVRPDIYRRLGLDDVADGPRTVTTGPPSYSDQLVVGILRTLRWLNETTGITLLSGLAGASILTDPPPIFMVGLEVTERRYNGWKVWEIASPEPSGEVVVALHGGGFESEANILHWTDYAQMARDTGATVLVPIYPLAPPKSTGTAETLVPPMADYLAMLIAEHGVDNVSLYGDSAGGSYAVLAVQEMLRRCKIDVTCVPSQAQPSRMVLVSPALHLTLRGPELDAIDDPILPRHKAGEGPRWNGDWSMDDPRVNPIAGADLTGLPPTAIYIGTLEKLYPGAIAFRDKLLSQDPQADLTVVIGDGQMHGWALGGIVVNSQAQLWRPTVYRQLGILPANRYVTLAVA